MPLSLSRPTYICLKLIFFIVKMWQNEFFYQQVFPAFL